MAPHALTSGLVAVSSSDELTETSDGKSSSSESISAGFLKETGEREPESSWSGASVWTAPSFMLRSMMCRGNCSNILLRNSRAAVLVTSLAAVLLAVDIVRVKRKV